MLFKTGALAAAFLAFSPENLVAETLGALTNSPVPPKLAREFRGVWVATVANIDWPSKPGLPTDQQKTELLEILDTAKRLNLNAIVLQVRPACDALYPSKIEPWSEFLTGEMGRAPEPFYDPLAFAIEESHKRGMELHAWINPYRAKHPSGKSKISSNHVSSSQPDLVVKYGKYLWLDPGKKVVQDYTLSIIKELLANYDLDGIHLDDYFYPYPERDENGHEMEFPDEETFLEYVAEGGVETIHDWRRENVNTLIKQAYDTIKATKPWVKFGISPFGIWKPSHPDQIRGMDAHEKIYCDSRKWIREGWGDYFAPQLYWKIETVEQSYPVLLQWWAEQNLKGRHLWPGNFTSRVDKEWQAEEIVNQIKATRTQKGADGNIHFSMKPLMQNRGKLSDELLRTVYDQPALIPSSPWLGKQQPLQPTLNVIQSDGQMKLEWDTPELDNIWQWLVQKRVNGTWVSAVFPVTQTEESIDSQTASALPDAVAVTALNRYGIASSPAIFTIK